MIHSRDWADLRANFDQNDDYPADITWNGQRMRNVRVRSRGLGSRSSDKPGLELDFDYYDPGQRFLGLRELVLDNLVTDPSMLREVVATSFLRRVGVPAPRESFARLFVNGEFAGLYAMVEAVNRDFAQAAFGGTGLLFEFRWTQPFYETYLGDGLGPYATLFESRNPAPQSTAGLYAPIRDLFRAINETPNGQFAAVDRHLDINGFIRLAAADAFLAELDGIVGYDGMNNVYLYSVGERSHLIPWDKDHAFWVADGSRTAATEHVLLAKMLSTQQVRQMYANALEAVVAAASGDDWLDATIARDYELVSDMALEDTRKHFDNEAFAAGVADLRALARARTGQALQDARRLRQD